jgi:2-polyprenyl-3-methyl-5-hydroxy-6-metoxy-1,4-benzoquinol methylase
MENINNRFFDGSYREIWRKFIPPELTLKETEFIVKYFGLTPSSHVLDLMCGYGRHALALAESGIKVTAIDNQDAYISEINIQASSKNLPITALNKNLQEYFPQEEFDLAIFMGNSLNFFSLPEIHQIFQSLNTKSNPTSSILIHSWSISEIAIPLFKEKTWATVGGKKILSDSKFLFQPTRIESVNTIIDEEGVEETIVAIDYIYSFNEMESILNLNGFELKAAFSIPGKKNFALGDPRIYMIATKK